MEFWSAVLLHGRWRYEFSIHCNDWFVVIGTDIGAVLQNILLRDGISDLKWVFQSNVGSISFMVDTVERGPLTVCQCQGSYNSYPKNYDFLEVH